MTTFLEWLIFLPVAGGQMAVLAYLLAGFTTAVGLPEISNQSKKNWLKVAGVGSVALLVGLVGTNLLPHASKLFHHAVAMTVLGSVGIMTPIAGLTAITLLFCLAVAPANTPTDHRRVYLPMGRLIVWSLVTMVVMLAEVAVATVLLAPLH